MVIILHTLYLIIPDLTPIFWTVCAMPTDQIATSTQVKYISLLLCVKIFHVLVCFKRTMQGHGIPLENCALLWLKFDQSGLRENKKNLAPL